MKWFFTKLFIAFTYTCVVLAATVAFCLMIIPYLIVLMTLGFGDDE